MLIYESNGGYAVSLDGLQLASFLTKKEAESYIKTTSPSSASKRAAENAAAAELPKD